MGLTWSTTEVAGGALNRFPSVGLDKVPLLVEAERVACMAARNSTQPFGGLVIDPAQGRRPVIGFESDAS